MDVKHKLNDELLKQKFIKKQELSARLDECKQIALSYARVENSIAVLSDMKTNTSYIFYGGVAEILGLAKRSTTKIIHSIWEEEIFSCIHPDDLLEKHLQELRFFNFLKTIPKKERTDYHIANNIRMCDSSGKYVQVLHRMFYIASQSNDSIWLALCLYNLSTNTSSGNIIINSVDGGIFESEAQTTNNILSSRETEVLLLIDKGKMSKEIASDLSISINTVNRHRQNILEKLHVDNSIEACRIAKGLKLF